MVFSKIWIFDVLCGRAFFVHGLHGFYGFCVSFPKSRGAFRNKSAADYSGVADLSSQTAAPPLISYSPLPVLRCSTLHVRWHFPRPIQAHARAAEENADDGQHNECGE